MYNIYVYICRILYSIRYYYTGSLLYNSLLKPAPQILKTILLMGLWRQVQMNPLFLLFEENTAVGICMLELDSGHSNPGCQKLRAQLQKAKWLPILWEPMAATLNG